MKKKEDKQPKSQVVPEILFGPDGPKYKDYLRRHAKELRRLQRELNGDNMRAPPEDWDA